MWLFIIIKNSPCYWESNSLLFLQEFLTKVAKCNVVGENRDSKKIKFPVNTLYLSYLIPLKVPTPPGIIKLTLWSGLSHSCVIL